MKCDFGGKINAKHSVQLKPFLKMPIKSFSSYRNSDIDAKWPQMQINVSTISILLIHVYMT